MPSNLAAVWDKHEAKIFEIVDAIWNEVIEQGNPDGDPVNDALSLISHFCASSMLVFMAKMHDEKQPLTILQAAQKAEWDVIKRFRTGVQILAAKLPFLED